MQGLGQFRVYRRGVRHTVSITIEAWSMLPVTYKAWHDARVQYPQPTCPYERGFRFMMAYETLGPLLVYFARVALRPYRCRVQVQKAYSLGFRVYVGGLGFRV